MSDHAYARRQTRRGVIEVIIDLRSVEGIPLRRIKAPVQSLPAAEAEGRRIVQCWHRTGQLPEEYRPKVQDAPATTPERPSDPTVDDAIAYFREHGLPTYKASTRAGYERLLDGPHFRFWSGKLLSEVTKTRVKAWRETIPGDGTTRNNQALLQTILRWVGPDADDDQPGVLLDVVPRLKLPKIKKKTVTAAHPDDVRNLLKACRDRTDGLEVAVALGSLACLRAGEIRALKKKDVDFRRNVLHVRLSLTAGELGLTKGGDEREVQIDPTLLEILQRRTKGLKPDDHVSTNSKGKPWDDWGLYKRLRTLCKRLGIDHRRAVHALRHGAVTDLFASGADAVTVQGIVGHAELATTQRYAHYSKERAKAAIAARAARYQGNVVDLDSRRVKKRKSKAG